jgi:hypothetical protein
LKSNIYPLRAVVFAVEEWRTDGNNRFPREKTWKLPARCRCDCCELDSADQRP